MRHHTKSKGDLGVFAVQLDLHKKGFIVCIPLTEHSPFDLIAYKKGVTYTLQVKTRTINKTGALSVKLSSTWADKNGSHSKPVDKELVDLYAVYCIDNNQCYYVDHKKFGNSFTLRVRPLEEKNKASNINDINWHKDYLDFPMEQE